MFQKTVQNTDDIDVFCKLFRQKERIDSADSAYDQIDFDVPLRRFIKMVDDFIVDQRIDFHRNHAGILRSGELRLPVDVIDEFFLDIERSNPKFIPVRRT